MITGKFEIEINCVGQGEDHRKYLNFWDWAHGNDVTAEIQGDKILAMHPEGTYYEEITFHQFLDRVYESILKRDL